MSVLNLSTAYTDRYVNAPKVRAMNAAGNQQLPVPSNPVSEPTTFTDNAKALAAYIPGDILTLYLSATTAIQHWTFHDTPNLKAGDVETSYLMIAFWVCCAFTPVWAAVIGIIAAIGPTYSWKAWLWPAASGTVAFVAYSYAVPGSFLAPKDQNYGITASFAVLFVTPILHVIGLLYTKFVKP